MEHGSETWLLPDSITVRSLLTTIAGVFSLREEPSCTTTAVYSDTFDWRLFQQGYMLCYHKPGWSLVHPERGEESICPEGPELRKACFSWDFPPDRLREILEQMLSVRCLLPLVTVAANRQLVHLLNRDDKTVARLVFEEQRPAGKKKTFRTVRLLRLRGYDAEADEVRRLLSESGIHQSASSQIGFEEGLRASGRFPLDYSSKLSLQLEPEQTARQAMVRIYKHLLATMQRNIPGVLDDLDSEFLHDFRVAIRRTRSGLSLTGKLFPEAVVGAFKADFGFLGAMTGPTRDLDVYLLYRDDYCARLPPRLQEGLADFFGRLALRRGRELKKLTRALQSRRARKILSAWEKFLVSEENRPDTGTDVPVIDLAGKIIYRRYKQVLRAGQALTATTPDEEVHRLRIQGKKLRYAIEFFSSLYPPDDIQTVVRQLKKLQDVLGDFNDLSIQQQLLERSIDDLQPESRRSLKLAAALGGLMHSLFQEQLQVRDHFASIFTHFSSEENIALFTGLFKPIKEKG